MAKDRIEQELECSAERRHVGQNSRTAHGKAPRRDGASHFTPGLQQRCQTGLASRLLSVTIRHGKHDPRASAEATDSRVQDLRSQSTALRCIDLLQGWQTRKPVAIWRNRAAPQVPQHANSDLKQSRDAHHLLRVVLFAAARAVCPFGISLSLPRSVLGVRGGGVEVQSQRARRFCATHRAGNAKSLRSGDRQGRICACSSTVHPSRARLCHCWHHQMSGRRQGSQGLAGRATGKQW